MKLIRTIIVSLLLTVSLPAVSIDLDSLTERIDQIIYEELPEGTDIALMVYDLTNDTTLYAYREKIMCRPASVQKVLSPHSLHLDLITCSRQPSRPRAP